jgi:hypothetical protein
MMVLKHWDKFAPFTSAYFTFFYLRHNIGKNTFEMTHSDFLSNHIICTEITKLSSLTVIVIAVKLGRMKKTGIDISCQVLFNKQKRQTVFHGDDMDFINVLGIFPSNFNYTVFYIQQDKIFPIL